MRLSGASQIAPDGKNPRTHRIGWEEIRLLAMAWRQMRKGEVIFAARRLEDVLDSIDPRWRSE